MQHLACCPWPVDPSEDNVNLYDLLLEDPPAPKPKRQRKKLVRVVKR